MVTADNFHIPGSQTFQGVETGEACIMKSRQRESKEDIKSFQIRDKRAAFVQFIFCVAGCSSEDHVSVKGRVVLLVELLYFSLCFDNMVPLMFIPYLQMATNPPPQKKQITIAPSTVVFTILKSVLS